METAYLLIITLMDLTVAVMWAQLTYNSNKTSDISIYALLVCTVGIACVNVAAFGDIIIETITGGV